MLRKSSRTPKKRAIRSPGTACRFGRFTKRCPSRPVRRSAHGPVIRSTRESALAIRIAGLDRPGALEVWVDFARARSLEQFDAVLRRMELPGFTVVYADRDGNIMEFFGGLPPVRNEGDSEFWSAHVPGDRGEAARRLVSDLIVAARASNRPVAHDAARVLAEWDLRYEPESRGVFSVLSLVRFVHGGNGPVRRGSVRAAERNR